MTTASTWALTAPGIFKKFEPNSTLSVEPATEEEDVQTGQGLTPAKSKSNRLTSNYDILDKNYYNKLSFVVPSSPDIIIHAANMEDYDLEKHHTLAISAPCGMGKTEMIAKTIFNKYPNLKILVVTFRIAQVDKAMQDWQLHHFTRYNQIKLTINIDPYNPPNMIVQIDSIFKIIGKYDVLILDEIEYTLDHMITFAGKTNFTKYDIYHALRQHIKETKYVIALDALLSDATINFLKSCKRDPYIIVYDTPKHRDKAVYVHTDQIKFTSFIFDKAKEGSRVLVPTNSKKWAEKLAAKLEQIEGIKIGLFTDVTLHKMRAEKVITGDPVDIWNQFDVVIFTPCIVAGSSFTLEYFDLVCGHFTSLSSHAEMACQQLFRARTSKKREIHIHVKNKGGGQIWANKLAGVKHHFSELYEKSIKSPDFHYPGLTDSRPLFKYNHREGILDENSPYFELFCNIEWVRELSRRDYLKRLLMCLKRQGVQFGGVIKPSEEEKEDLAELAEELKEIGHGIGEKEIIDIVEAPDIMYETAVRLADNPNHQFIASVKKAKLRRLLGLTDEAPLTVELVKGYKDRISQRYNIKKFLPLLGMTDEEEIAEKSYEILSKDLPPDLPPTTEEKLMFLKKGPWIKAQQLNIVRDLLIINGFSSIFDNSYSTLNLEASREYILKSNADKFFNTNYNKVKSDDRQLLQWINERLSIVGVKIKRKNTKSTEYYLSGLSDWILDKKIVVPKGTDPIHIYRDPEEPLEKSRKFEFCLPYIFVQEEEAARSKDEFAEC